MSTKRSSWCGVRAGLAILAGLAAGAPAMADGPDVIVGELPDVSNWTQTGPINGMRAYSVGTTSCNVGTLRLAWIANTNGHPVIGGNLYKLENGRFTQIGQSWLKHGFTALQGTVCFSNCVANPDGTYLGVRCSDPYSSGLNGSQSRLGPKSEVNAATGWYYYGPTGQSTRPTGWINNGTGTGELFKRLQVRDSDLTDGAMYFLASMYVTWDDAQSGNGLNNQSYRRATLGAAPARNLTLTGSTQRERAAIYAWQDHGLGINTPDPRITITTTDVPGDGRFLAASKVTGLGNGTWRYEYAIQNFNSDRSAGAFRVPLPAGAVVTNAGFSCPFYHSGEPFVEEAWTPSISASEIVWATPGQYIANPPFPALQVADTANALRWDTIYTFWFDCNMAPDTGAGTLNLFKPGTPETVPVGVRVPSGSGISRPDNDDFLFAMPVNNGTTNFTTVDATNDGPVESSCGGNIDRDVWFRYTSNCAGPTTFSLCGSGFDTKLAVYPNSPAVPAAGTALACNDNDPFCNSGGETQSSVTINAAASTTYLIRIGGANNAQGNGAMTITGPNCTPGAPANDLQANARWLADGEVVTGSTLAALNDGTASCGNSGTSADVWFKYRPISSGVVTVTTCDSAYNTVVSITNQGTGQSMGCNDNAQTGPCAGTTQSYAAFVGAADTTYLIRLAGANGSRGNYTLRLTGGGGTIPSANDACFDRVALPVGSTPFSTLVATTDGPATPTCGAGSTISGDIWYNFQLPSASSYTISATGATYDAKLAAYSGAGCNALDTRLVACDDGSGNGASITVSGNAGQNFTIRVGGVNGAAGTGTLVVAEAPACVADFDDGTQTGTRDGAVTIDDLLYYIDLFGNGAVAADVDDGTGTGSHDSAVTIDDLVYFLARFDLGC